MHIGVDAYETEIRRHVEALQQWQTNALDIRAEQAVIVEMHLLSCALYVRKMDEHHLVDHIKPIQKNMHLGNGQTRNLKQICDVLIHSTELTTDAASVAGSITVKSDRDGPYKVPYRDLVKAFADYQYVQSPRP